VLTSNEKQRHSGQPLVRLSLPLVRLLHWESQSDTETSLYVGATPTSSSGLGGQGDTHEDRLGELEHSDLN